MKKYFTPAFVALLYTPILLTTFEYWFLPFRIERWLNTNVIYSGPTIRAGVIWGIACVIGYSIIPMIVTKVYFKENLKSIGVSIHDFKKHLPTYLGLYLLMVIPIFIAASTPGFQHTYPFVPEVKTDFGKFIIWEVAYVCQFFALESFFRGYLLMTLEKVVGASLAIGIMVIPYAMIHFHKPAIETFGAIGAGIILGHLSLKYRTWMGGAVLHSLVAITMDTIAVSRAGLF
ncbi:MAG: hypothetical protein A4S09_01160 [Proteobacteria bacterium SG_bin7]|nr:MAG: hypothetical protein A4S09_01160 [Proteobacteria bacterium SG_bin7]